MRPLVSLAMLLLALLLAGAHPAAAAGSRLAIEDGHARIIVTWDAPVAFTIDRSTTSLVVTADRPFPTDLDILAETVERGFATLAIDADRMALRIRAHPEGAASVRADGDRSLAIELASVTSPSLGLRIGQHADFVRAVVEPIDPRAVSVVRSGDRLNLDLPGRLTADDLERLAGLAGIADLAAAHQQLVLTLKPGVTVHDHVVAPDKLVLDIRRSANDETSSKPATGSKPTPLAAGLASHRPMPRPSRRTGPASVAATPGPMADVPAIPLGETAPAGAVNWRSSHFTELKVTSRVFDDRSIELLFAWPEPVPAAAFVRAGQLWLAFGATAEALDVDAAALTRIAGRWISSMRAEPHAEATLFRLALTRTAPAAMRPDGSGWRLTLGPQALASPNDRGTVSSGSPQLGPDQGEVIGSTDDGVRLRGIDMLIETIDPLVGDRLGIGLALQERAMQPRDLARFVGLRFLPTLQGAAWRQLTDLSAASEAQPGVHTLGPIQGVARRWGRPASEVEAVPDKLAEAEAAEVAEIDHQGAAAPPLVTASVRATGDAEAANAVHEQDAAEPELAAAEAREDASSQAGSPAVTVAGPLDLARHKAKRGVGFWSRRSELLQQLAAAPSAEREPAELALARLLVAHGLGLEALSLLGEPDSTPAGAVTVGGEPAARPALTGAAQFLAGRAAAARQTLDDPRLAMDDETALWRAAALAAGQQWDDALALWQRGQAFLEHYPASTQAALGEEGVMLLLQNGHGDEAMALIEHLQGLRLDPAAADRVRALEAIALERDGALDEARAIWRRLSRHGSAESRSRAVLALVELDLAAERIDLAQAIARLVDDQVHWRGQADEIRLERRLAALQRSAGQPEAALATLRAVIDRQPAAEAVELVTAEMTDIFDELFDAFVAGERDATSMLRLYRTHGELLSPDDGRVEDLAAALAELGLLDAATGLLRDQLGRRTARDAGRARIGHELARLLAQDGDRRGALAALVDSTPVDAIPDSLAQARRELLASLNDEEAAVPQAAALSARDKLRQAFDQEDWLQVIDAARPLEGALTPDQRLDAEASELVLMLAIAARATGDDARVEILQQRYGETLSSADAAVLGLLAKRPRFSGEAATVLADAAEHTRKARSALADLPPP